jgi:hypothetical protein
MTVTTTSWSDNALLAQQTAQLSNKVLRASYAHTKRVFGTPLLRAVQRDTPEETKGRYVNTTARLLATAPDPPIMDISNGTWEQTCYKAVHPDTGEAVEYKQLQSSRGPEGHLWTECCAEEIGWLAQGYKCTVGMDTIHFIKVTDIPPGRKATYLQQFLVAGSPNKENPHRVRFTVGRDKVEYPGEVPTKTAGLTTAKILFSSVISTPGA